MEYEYDDFSVIVPNYLLNSDDSIDNTSISESEEGNEFATSGEFGENDIPSGLPYVLYGSGDCYSDYTSILESIDGRLETLTLQVNEVKDNTYRLYYFIGGMYVAFAIVLAIKFLKQFF